MSVFHQVFQDWDGGFTCDRHHIDRNHWISHLTCGQCEDTDKPHTFHNEFEETRPVWMSIVEDWFLWFTPKRSKRNRQAERFLCTLLLSGLFICHVVLLGCLVVAIAVVVYCCCCRCYYYYYHQNIIIIYYLLLLLLLLVWLEMIGILVSVEGMCKKV